MPDVLYTDTPFTAVSTMVVVTYLPHSCHALVSRDARHLESFGHLSLTRAPVPPRMALLSLGCGVVSAIKPRTLQRSAPS
jgi:hypothetical protein